MVSCFGRVLALKHSQKSEMFLSVVLDRLAEYRDVLDEDVAEDLLTKIEAISETLNEFTLSELNRISHVFPREVLLKHVKINSKISQDSAENKFKLCLQLVCDPAYSLSQYCYELDSCLKENDGDKFEATFKVMLSLTNNEFAGPSFQLLTKYTDALKDIQDYEYTKEYNKKARKAIHDVLTDMSSAQKSSLTLPLSELCPALTSGSVGASEEDRKSLSRLLRLDGLEVVRFEKQVQVYLGSIRRPCTISVLCSDGRTRRFLVKRGEPLRSVAAVHTALAYFNRVQTSTAGGSHHVIPLSEDCAVMQYLEDHVTVRSMVAKKYNLNGQYSGCR
ncbi:uncharacterized protein LOC125490468 [Plutella xylostella]|uniref:uncharacterized protein LOC125490468 n=1 Tax=Plutella xylostella TaxID=51655 RepID=UPI002032D237|nr:uncharacterized protein LOC125490468 [Plutella xylostella]